MTDIDRDLLIALKTSHEHMATSLSELRQDVQRVVGILDAVSALDRRLTSLDATTRALFNKADPLLHSDPPLTTRVRNTEEGVAEARTKVEALSDDVKAAKATTRQLIVWTVLFLLAGVLNAVIQFGGGS